jgi:hypothetical protein
MSRFIPNSRRTSALGGHCCSRYGARTIHSSCLPAPRRVDDLLDDLPVYFVTTIVRAGASGCSPVLSQQLKGLGGAPAAALFTSCFRLARTLLMDLRRRFSLTLTVLVQG